MWLDLATSHRQTWLFSSTSTYHSTDLLTERGVAHLVQVHGTSGSTSYETIPQVRLETSEGVLSTVDMVVLRRDSPRRLRDHDDSNPGPTQSDALTTRPLRPAEVCALLCRVPALYFPAVLHEDYKGKGSPYSTAEHRVSELIPVLGSQPAGDVNHKPDGRLPLLSTRPAVTPATLKMAATNFASW